MAIPYFYQEIEQIYARSIAKGARTITVTSSHAGEGTSSLACALAQRARAAEQNVLLVDMNLHNPFVNARLSDAGNNWDPTQPTLPQQIDVGPGPSIPAIAVPEQASAHIKYREQLMLQTLIDQWLHQHDILIFDTSPLCQVNQRNIPAQTVAACCDATLLIVRAGRTESARLEQAVGALRAVNANLTGTVINDLDNPPLATELARQCRLFLKRWPTLSTALQQWLLNNRFLCARS